MVGSSYINIHTLTLDELAGVVNLYPWYGAARVELCRRMALMGEDWGEDQYAAEALFVPDRGKVAVLLRQGRQTDCSDKDLSALLSSYMEPSAPEEVQEHQVRAVGGDYFSQAQYDNVRQSGDKVDVDLFIIVEYGISISAVAASIIETVKYKVEHLTGVQVGRVNVSVEDIRV